MNIKLVIAGAVSGFVTAFLTDLNAWSRSTPKGEANAPFDWSLAVKRWVAGAMAGGAAAAGWNVTVGV